MPVQPKPEPFRPEESPIAWFGELLLAVDRQDFRRATQAQRELGRLGWCVTQRKPRQRPHQTNGKGGGR